MEKRNGRMTYRSVAMHYAAAFLPSEDAEG